MDHQLLASGIGLSFAGKPHFFPQGKHVLVLVQHNAVYCFKVYLFGNGKAFFKQVRPNALAPGIYRLIDEPVQPASG